jgi:hypothetical protein
VEGSRDSEEESDEDGINPSGTSIPLGQVKAVPRLLPYLTVMMDLTAAEDPPLRRGRASGKVNIIYCYGTRLEVVLDGVLISVTEYDTSWVNGVSLFKRRHLITGI